MLRQVQVEPGIILNDIVVRLGHSDGGKGPATAAVTLVSDAGEPIVALVISPVERGGRGRAGDAVIGIIALFYVLVDARVWTFLRTATGYAGVQIG
ncbi:MAG: hypothetical protein DRJ03_26755 [Chloroflexi bacterium]|nr:MAG: hypothetical protein DRJ03_26755 [Chloroflexota bacterium]